MSPERDSLVECRRLLVCGPPFESVGSTPSSSSGPRTDLKSGLATSTPSKSRGDGNGGKSPPLLSRSLVTDVGVVELSRGECDEEAGSSEVVDGRLRVLGIVDSEW